MNLRWLVFLACAVAPGVAAAQSGSGGLADKPRVVRAAPTATGDDRPADERPGAGERTAAAAEDSAPWNLVSPTLGGMQFWTDELVWCDWRIQRNAWTGHCRLLDPDNRRIGWGSFDDCRRLWVARRAELMLPAPRKPVVILMHGLGRSRDKMQPLADYLARETDYDIVNFSYASTREDVAKHAASLAHVVDGLNGAERVDFVCHSLGNIVLRRYLNDRDEAAQRAAAKPMGRPANRPAEQPGATEPPQVAVTTSPPPLGRIVMLGPPNNGAQIARKLRDVVVFRVVAGDAGQRLGADADEFDKKLATPKCEFGIIAGSTANGVGRNPLIAGDDDLLVSIEETKLPGAADFIVLNVSHGRLVSDDAAQRATLSFLRLGRFDEQRIPQRLPPRP